MHCGGADKCAGEACIEYAGGDHFLIPLKVCFNVEKDPRGALPFFPAAWHNKGRWKNCFDKAHPALLELEALVAGASDVKARVAPTSW